jgi:hypothetical protein
LVNAAAAAHAIGLIQTPFVMLRFIFDKAAWLTPCDGERFRIERSRVNLILK